MLTAVFLAVSALPSAASEGVRVIQVDTSHYPQVQLVVAAPPPPGDTVRSPVFSIDEGGRRRPVDGRPVAGRDVVVALALDWPEAVSPDTARSLQAAAVELLLHLPTSARVSVVPGQGAVPAPPPASRATALAAVAALSDAGDAGVITAFGAGVDVLSGTLAQHRALVVMTSRAEPGAFARVPLLEDQAVDAAVAVYPIALGPGFTGSELPGLARATGGRAVAAADPDELRRAAASVGQELRHLHVLTYEAEGSGTQDVEVSVEGVGTTTVTVTGPEAPAQERGPLLALTALIVVVLAAAVGLVAFRRLAGAGAAAPRQAGFGKAGSTWAPSWARSSKERVATLLVRLRHGTAAVVRGARSQVSSSRLRGAAAARRWGARIAGLAATARDVRRPRLSSPAVRGPAAARRWRPPAAGLAGTWEWSTVAARAAPVLLAIAIGIVSGLAAVWLSAALGP